MTPPRKNSAWNAEHKVKYEAETNPKNLPSLIDTINMWGCYIKWWGNRVDDRIGELEAAIKVLKPDWEPAPGRGTSHLDPPPDEPYTPPAA